VTHAADAVFDPLVAAILRGEIAPGAALPSERTLVGRFGVSRMVVRQAVHRLEELGLVRTRPGGATIVLDPGEANDLRVLGLLYAVSGRRDPTILRDVREKQFLQGLALIDIAARRARPEALEAIRDDVESWAREPDPRASFDRFEERFWRALAVAGGNRIARLEIAWWYRLLSEHPAIRYAPTTPTPLLVGFYRELARKLAEGEAAVAYYHQVVSSLLSST
jgi:DNA-binding FadR family transcriptional regulator